MPQTPEVEEFLKSIGPFHEEVQDPIPDSFKGGSGSDVGDSEVGGGSSDEAEEWTISNDDEMVMDHVTKRETGKNSDKSMLFNTCTHIQMPYMHTHVHMCAHT